MHLYAQFLNNSSSRWEAICQNWQVQAELVDTVSPIYRSDFQRYGGVPYAVFTPKVVGQITSGFSRLWFLGAPPGQSCRLPYSRTVSTADMLF